jgi:hypothetical protein
MEAQPVYETVDYNAILTPGFQDDFTELNRLLSFKYYKQLETERIMM